MNISFPLGKQVSFSCQTKNEKFLPKSQLSVVNDLSFIRKRFIPNLKKNCLFSKKIKLCGCVLIQTERKFQTNGPGS